ncbi:permease [Paenibacillus sinopodophylli]|uniref:permease n=1 Tax=Paenibacillus sinopodophylli TaxID=1837342 RepID=UPI00110C9B92|nr:permease [Paenibacillus sinopodophylli]
MTTLYQLNTIFISMVMEAIPFVLVGVLISGLIQTFVKDHWIARIMPRNRFLATIFGCGIGIFFPSCECGIVPITKRLINKGMPLHAGIAFMLTGPIINPIVLFSTYIAFGNDWEMVGIRAGLAVVVAFSVSIIISFLFKDLPFRVQDGQAAAASEHGIESKAIRITTRKRLYEVIVHAIEEFFSVGKYLVLGAFIAACMQTFVPTSYLLHLGSNPVTSSLVMIALAFLISLCSEADAFIAASFRSTFTVGSLSAFLVFGPMIDIKNTLMLLGTYRSKFVFTLIGLVTVFTLLGSLLVGRLFG